MSVICPNCGLSNELDSRFCSQCGFQIPIVEPSSYHEFSPPAPSSKPVVFVSNSPRRSHRSRCTSYPRPPRRQHSGWFLGAFFLIFGLVFALFLLVPFVTDVSFDHHTDWDGFGDRMGNWGDSFGERMDDWGSSFGDRMGDFFDNLGNSIGDSFSSPFSSHSFSRSVFFFIPVFIFLFGAVMILFSRRSSRRSA